MKKVYFIIILAVFCILESCTINEVGPPGQDGVSDQQIRLEFGTELITADTNWVNLPDEFDLIKFDRDNYVELDSIQFVAGLESTFNGDTCFVQLINKTNGNPITDATLMSDTTAFQFLETSDIFDNLPTNETNLGLRIRSSRLGTEVRVNRAFLFLYR